MLFSNSIYSCHSFNDRFDSFKLSFSFSAVLHNCGPAYILPSRWQTLEGLGKRKSFLDVRVRHHQGYHTGVHGARDKICPIARGKLNWKVFYIHINKYLKRPCFDILFTHSTFIFLNLKYQNSVKFDFITTLKCRV